MLDCSPLQLADLPLRAVQEHAAAGGGCNWKVKKQKKIKTIKLKDKKIKTIKLMS